MLLGETSCLLDDSTIQRFLLISRVKMKLKRNTSKAPIHRDETSQWELQNCKISLATQSNVWLRSINTFVRTFFLVGSIHWKLKFSAFSFEFDVVVAYLAIVLEIEEWTWLCSAETWFHMWNTGQPLYRVRIRTNTFHFVQSVKCRHFNIINVNEGKIISILYYPHQSISSVDATKSA